MFYMRVDANATLGAGHVMRCLSIAEALKEMGKVTIFIVADEDSATLVKKKGFGYLILNSRWDNLETELELITEIITENKMQSILIDSYYVTEKYLATLNKITKVFYVDDLGKNAFEVDTLINYNIYAQELNYEQLYAKEVKQRPNLLLGCKYTPLRREFWSVEYSVQKNAKNVLITTGGADLHQVAVKLLERMERNQKSLYRTLHFHVVSGAYNKGLQTLRKLERTNSNFHVYENVTHMANLMQKCDIAIGAYGSTMYELAVLGVPTIGFSFVDNQELAAHALGRGYTINAGNLSENEEEVLNTIMIKLEQLSIFYHERCVLHDKMNELLDGSGARRLADILKQNS